MDWGWPFFWGGFWFIIVFGLLVLAFDIWMLVDAIQRPPVQYPSPDAKTWWIVGLVVGLATGLPAIAVAIAYYIVVRRPAGPPRLSAIAGTASSPPAAPGVPAVPIRTPAPINCRSCGAKLAAAARFCHSCGTPVQPEGT
jgi:hypothetical protein